MILDSSALVAIIAREPEADAFETILAEGFGPLRLSAATYLETGIVLDRTGVDELSLQLDVLVDGLGIEIMPVTEAHARIARRAYRRFGKGTGHRAQLNFGDCLAYALAFESGEPLMYKGGDFSHTDIDGATA